MKDKGKYNTVFTTFLIVGLIMYLTGLLLLVIYLVGNNDLFGVLKFTNNVLSLIKILGIILFVMGFILFIISIIKYYKDNAIGDSNKELIIEGKADVITIMVTTYIMLIMLVICLVYDQVLGAILFAVLIGLQSLINSILLKYFSKKVR